MEHAVYGCEITRIGGLCGGPGVGHILAAVALEGVKSEGEMGAEIGAVDEGKAGVGEVLQGDVHIVRFGPTIAKKGGALALACLDGKTRPALRRHLRQHVKRVKALI